MGSDIAVETACIVRCKTVWGGEIEFQMASGKCVPTGCNQS